MTEPAAAPHRVSERPLSLREFVYLAVVIPTVLIGFVTGVEGDHPGGWVVAYLAAVPLTPLAFVLIYPMGILSSVLDWLLTAVGTQTDPDGIYFGLNASALVLLCYLNVLLTRLLLQKVRAARSS